MQPEPPNKTLNYRDPRAEPASRTRFGQIFFGVIYILFLAVCLWFAVFFAFLLIGSIHWEIRASGGLSGLLSPLLIVSLVILLFALAGAALMLRAALQSITGRRGSKWRWF